MQDKFSIDDPFRDRLHRAESVPPPMVWENVAAELARQKRRRLVGYWAVGGLATVGVLAVAWLFFAPGGAGKTEGSAQNLAAQNDAPTGGLPTADFAFEKNQSANLGENQAGISAQNRPEISPEKAAGQFENAAPETGFPKIGQPKTATAKPVFVEKIGAALGNLKAQNLTVGFQNQTEFIVQTVENQPVENSGEAQNAAADPSSISKKETGLTTQSPASLTNFDQLAGRELSSLKTKKTASQPPIRKFKIKKRKPVCPSFADRGEVFFLDFYAGPGMAFRTLSPRDGDTPGFVKLRNETEKSKFAWSAGARAGWLFSGKYMLRAGLHLTQVQERFNFYDPNDFTYTVDVNPQTGQRDTTYHYGEHFIERTNYLHLLDLPLTIGIEQGHGAFGWSLHGGVAANLLFLKNGKIIDPDSNQPTARKPSLKVNAGISLLANAQVFYQIDKKSRVFIEPYYQRVLRPVSKKSQPAEERYSFGGLSFGYTRLLK